MDIGKRFLLALASVDSKGKLLCLKFFQSLHFDFTLIEINLPHKYQLSNLLHKYVYPHW